jgi:hypothetical protein
VWSGTKTSGELAITEEWLYGGEDQGGGLAALINFLPGDNTQEIDPYLVKKLGADIPAYRGVASLVWYGPSVSIGSITIPALGSANIPSGYIGTSAAPRPLTVEVSRYPQQLKPAESMIGDDANPIECIYECLTTDPNGPDGWGMGLAPSMIDTSAFIAAAHQCYTEGFGISFAWSEQTSIENVIQEICKTIDAVCFRDFKTGLWTIKLMRGGYNVDTLPVLDVSNVLELENYSQTGIDGTINEVKINYLDRSQNYRSMPAQAQDLANMRTQGEVISSTMTMKMITTAALGDRVANRELLAQSTALSKADLICNRSAYAFSPGDLVVLKWEPLGITKMVARVVKSAIGMPNANRIRLSVIQDIFSLSTSTFMVGGGTNWTDPITNPAPITNQRVAELPYFFNTDETKASYMVCAERPNTGCVTFEVWEKLQAETAYIYRDTCLSYTPVGVLGQAYQSTPAEDIAGFTISGGIDINTLSNAAADELRTGQNVAMWETGELFAFQTVTSNPDGTLTIGGIWSGLFDTVPSLHNAGEKIWFFGYGASNPEDKVAQDAQINVKNLPTGPRGSVALDAATAINATMVARNTKPYPPGKVAVNTMLGLRSSIGPAMVTWARRNKLAQTQVVRQDDPDDTAASGTTYVAEVYVGGALKYTCTTTKQELDTAISTAPSIGGLTTTASGISIAAVCQSDSFGSPITGADWLRDQSPSYLVKCDSSGITTLAGNPTISGNVDGAGSAARLKNPRSLVLSGATAFFIDNGSYIRSVNVSTGVVSTLVNLAPNYARITNDPGDPTQPRAILSTDCIYSLTIDGAGNLYCTSNTTRQIIKITQSGVVSVLATNIDLWSDAVITSDSTGNIFIHEYFNGTRRIRYRTVSGTITTIAEMVGGWNSRGGQVVIGSDLYYPMYGEGITKITPAGVITSPFTSALPSDLFGISDVAAAPGGFLSFSGTARNDDGPLSGTPYIGTVNGSGSVTKTFVAKGVASGYTAALRIKDSTDGSKLVEVRVKQIVSGVSSIYNSTGLFQMSGFGMCFGQLFGGKQS